MRRLINNRDTTCVFPTCRQPATRTDCDHTLAYDHGGPTCPCNLALLCRGHHRAKVRHEALVYRMEVEDLHRLSVTAVR